MKLFKKVSLKPDLVKRTGNPNVNVLDNSRFNGNVDWHGCSDISHITFG